MKSKALVIALALLASIPTYAQIFKLNFDYTYTGVGAAALETALQTEIQKAENEINEGLPSGEPTRLMKGMANSSVMSGKGVGSDYASDMEVALIGVGGGVGADLEKDETTDSDISGLGAQGGVIIGTNLGWLGKRKILGLDADRLNVYVNFFSYNYEKDFDKSSAGIKMSSFGAHASYLWKKGNSNKLARWGGLLISTGIERNSTEFSFETDINETADATSGAQTGTVTITGKPKASINAATTSIPLEISTSVQFLYFLSLYTGLGVDYNMGYAEGKGALNANPSTVTCTSGCGPGSVDVGTVSPTANIDAKEKVDSFLTRGFFGVQFNLPYTRIFVQADKAFGSELIGATAGLRFVY